MEWNRSNTVGLAVVSCSFCHGYGLRFARYGKEVPCACVYRAIFRACYNRFREYVAKGAHTSTVTLEFCSGAERRRTYCRKREEFMADFCLVSQRVLDDLEQKVFRFHFLLGANCKLCCRRLQIDRGTFFHIVYEIEQRLGRTFAELEPYPLFPLDEYFSGMIRRVEPCVPRRRPSSSLAQRLKRRLPLSA